MKAQSFFWGLLGLLPAFVLMFSASEFNLMRPEGDLGPRVLTAVIVGFASAWSCYIMSIVPILQNKAIPTSHEGMLGSIPVAIPFAIGQIVYHYFRLDHFTIASGVVLAIGTIAAAMLQGFYIGFSKARLGAEEARAFIFRVTGLVASGALLTVFVFIAYAVEYSWFAKASILMTLGTTGMLGLLYLRASRQRKRYLARRYKPRSTFNIESIKPLTPIS